MIGRDLISKRFSTICTFACYCISSLLGTVNKSIIVDRYEHDLPKFKHGSRILFQGDSITDMKWGRNQKDRNHYLGHSYVFLLASRLGVDMAKTNLEFFNRGVSGNKVSDLRNAAKDAIDMNPDWLTVLIGVNDVSQSRATHRSGKMGKIIAYLKSESKSQSQIKYRFDGSFVLRMTRLSSDEQWEHWRGEIEKLGKIVVDWQKISRPSILKLKRFLTKLPVKSHRSLDMGWCTSAATRS